MTRTLRSIIFGAVDEAGGQAYLAEQMRNVSSNGPTISSAHWCSS